MSLDFGSLCFPPWNLKQVKGALLRHSVIFLAILLWEKQARLRKHKRKPCFGCGCWSWACRCRVYGWPSRSVTPARTLRGQAPFFLCAWKSAQKSLNIETVQGSHNLNFPNCIRPLFLRYEKHGEIPTQLYFRWPHHQFSFIWLQSSQKCLL